MTKVSTKVVKEKKSHQQQKQKVQDKNSSRGYKLAHLKKTIQQIIIFGGEGGF